MNVARQRRKFTQAIADASSEEAGRYLAGLLELFEQGVACGQPQPFSQFYPMFQEEFSC